jgi:hypothetical protein
MAAFALCFCPLGDVLLREHAGRLLDGRHLFWF